MYTPNAFNELSSELSTDHPESERYRIGRFGRNVHSRSADSYGSRSADSCNPSIPAGIDSIYDAGREGGGRRDGNRDVMGMLLIQMGVLLEDVAC